jgi:hypothetical protein
MDNKYKRFTSNKSFDDALNKALDQKIYLQGVEVMKHYFIKNKTPQHSPLYQCARTNLLMHFGSLREVR